MKLLYFASVRQKIGIPGEEITLPAGIVDAAGLLDWLEGRGGVYVEALADRDACSRRDQPEPCRCRNARHG